MRFREAIIIRQRLVFTNCLLAIVLVNLVWTRLYTHTRARDARTTVNAREPRSCVLTWRSWSPRKTISRAVRFRNTIISSACRIDSTADNPPALSSSTFRDLLEDKDYYPDLMRFRKVHNEKDGSNCRFVWYMIKLHLTFCAHHLKHVKRLKKGIKQSCTRCGSRCVFRAAIILSRRHTRTYLLVRQVYRMMQFSVLFETVTWHFFVSASEIIGVTECRTHSWRPVCMCVSSLTAK